MNTALSWHQNPARAGTVFTYSLLVVHDNSSKRSDANMHQCTGKPWVNEKARRMYYSKWLTNVAGEMATLLTNIIESIKTTSMDKIIIFNFN